MWKQKLTRHNKIANVAYMVIDKTINLISECSKLVQKEIKTRHNWMGKVIH